MSKGIHKTTLPVSGEEVSFSEPRVGDIKKMLGATPIIAVDAVDGEGALQEDRSDTFDRTCELICSLSVDPKFTSEDEDKDGKRSLDNLHLRDFRHLADAIMNASGMNEAKTEADPT